jgi:hypothetical protein
MAVLEVARPLPDALPHPRCPLAPDPAARFGNPGGGCSRGQATPENLQV